MLVFLQDVKHPEPPQRSTEPIQKDNDDLKLGKQHEAGDLMEDSRYRRGGCVLTPARSPAPNFAAVGHCPGFHTQPKRYPY
eukprot:g35729.t1